MNKNIILTGASGFTGLYVKREFEQAGYKVICLSRTIKSKDDIYCDLTDKNSIKDALTGIPFSGLIHLAALSYVGSPDYSSFYSINTIGTTNLLETMDELNLEPSKVIIASSANIYGNTDKIKIDEEQPFNPQNHYAASKVAMELLLKNWFERFSILITRPFNYSGIGQESRFLVPKLVESFAKNHTNVSLGNLKLERDFTDVIDIAKCYIELFKCDANSQAVNLCSGKTISLSAIVNHLQLLSGYEIKIDIDQRFIRKMDLTTLCGNNDKLLKMTGYIPKHDFKKTLENMLIYAKSQ